MMDQVVFSRCAIANHLITVGREGEARDKVIQLLDHCAVENIDPPPVLNTLIRMVGLYPYLKGDLSWDEKFLREAFSADAGGGHKVVMHREQASVLKRLLEGDNLALSAPTSFGKSFIIDAYISIKDPDNVLIIVPTIALADETRRRLHSKFGADRKVITTTDDEPAESRNIFVFPQERAISYAKNMPELDLLIVDEFYKASKEFDRDRSATLIRAIHKFSGRARQRYFLAPNISALKESPFTQGMEFLKVDFNTVFLQKHDLFKEIGKNKEAKAEALVRILTSVSGKTLVYAGTYSGISEVAGVLLESLPRSPTAVLDDFKEWLIECYGPNWLLPRLVTRRVGIHNGQLHRCLSQIQVKLFEDTDGLLTLISTSSIIEGVNTSAQGVVLWGNKNGRFKLTDFDYKNIIGRGGRMLRHFVGHIYILEAPPEDSLRQLDIELPDSLLGLPEIQGSVEMTREQREKADRYNAEMEQILRGRSLAEVANDENFQSSDAYLLKKIAWELGANSRNWAGLAYLNSSDPDDWDWTLYKLLELEPGVWDIQYRKFVEFVKVLSKNWTSTIPELLEELADFEIDLELFFKLERNVSYRLASLVGDVNLMSRALGRDDIDVSSFAFKASNAFLPAIVFELEEYGFPRMLARKVHVMGWVDFEREDLTLREAIDELLTIGDRILSNESSFLSFERYIFRHFARGVTSNVAEVV